MFGWFDCVEYKGKASRLSCGLKGKVWYYEMKLNG